MIAHHIAGVLIMLAGCAYSATPAEDARRDMERQLQSRYPPFKLGPRGERVISMGAILVVRTPGIRATPTNQFTFMNTYQDGRIKYSKGSSLITNRNTTRDLQPGEGVYLYKVEAKENGVVLHVQACGRCEPSLPDPMPFRAGVTVALPKNWLQAPDLNGIDRMIAQVFDVPAAAMSQAPAPPPSPEPPPPPPAAEAPPVSQAPPVRIELGQTPEQVRAALGEPGKVIELGPKKLFVYKDLKVTFLEGKVSDVQ